MNEDRWEDISTAPRDGTIIEVIEPDVGAFAMRWNPNGFDLLTSKRKGVWELPSGGPARLTWSEDNYLGPTNWRLYKLGRHAN
ncbi:hypothetical protein Nham_2856 [Nitrobacter hamburgensis X14]|uniref:Uncharacterized protein n=1 Tax=Nitrobacter hamburgensis (strain DSM 10229 / NCIMB 13809 / X14) TaxID=323097 RepID=Q1QJH3_NITHX|nr:hypothetical protein [Nitrobacter hamburgensis]ABE63624.1 hypothetical protein Nham_2856 [Nitrobacter hamburgensis X14]